MEKFLQELVEAWENLGNFLKEFQETMVLTPFNLLIFIIIGVFLCFMRDFFWILCGFCWRLILRLTILVGLVVWGIIFLLFLVFHLELYIFLPGEPRIFLPGEPLGSPGKRILFIWLREMVSNGTVMIVMVLGKIFPAFLILYKQLLKFLGEYLGIYQDPGRTLELFHWLQFMDFLVFIILLLLLSAVLDFFEVDSQLAQDIL